MIIINDLILNHFFVRLYVLLFHRALATTLSATTRSTRPADLFVKRLARLA